MFCLGSFAIHNYYEAIDAVYDLNFQGLSGQSFLSLGLRTRRLLNFLSLEKKLIEILFLKIGHSIKYCYYRKCDFKLVDLTWKLHFG